MFIGEENEFQKGVHLEKRQIKTTTLNQIWNHKIHSRIFRIFHLFRFFLRLSDQFKDSYIINVFSFLFLIFRLFLFNCFYCGTLILLWMYVLLFSFVVMKQEPNPPEFTKRMKKLMKAICVYTNRCELNNLFVTDWLVLPYGSLKRPPSPDPWMRSYILIISSFFIVVIRTTVNILAKYA